MTTGSAGNIRAELLTPAAAATSGARSPGWAARRGAAEWGNGIQRTPREPSSVEHDSLDAPEPAQIIQWVHGKKHEIRASAGHDHARCGIADRATSGHRRRAERLGLRQPRLLERKQ